MNWAHATHALLRMMAGLLFIPHGIQKLFGLAGFGPRDGALMMTAGTIELVGGLLILIGFQTRWAAFLSSGLMASAYFMGHASKGFLWLNNGGNGGELAALYCFVFLYLWGNGSGKWSVDECLKTRRDS